MEVEMNQTLPSAAGVLVHGDAQGDHRGVPLAALLVVHTRIQDCRGKEYHLEA